jgi:hypothetical protein
MKRNLNDHPSEHGILPFIFYPTVDDQGDVSVVTIDENDVVHRKTIVIVAFADYSHQDAEWMDDELIGKHPLIPTVDWSLEEPHIFDDEKSALKWIRNWWKNAKLSDYDYFANPSKVD